MWHYLPVYMEAQTDEGGRVFWLLEVLVNDRREVQSWHDASPEGDTIEEMQVALHRMNNDLLRFEAVRRTDIRVGMVPTLRPEFRAKLKAEKAKKPKRAAR